MSTKMNSKIYKIGDRVANASLNALSGCIVCKLGTVIAVDNGMIEIKNDGDRVGHPNWIFTSSDSVKKLS